MIPGGAGAIIARRPAILWPAQESPGTPDY